MEAKMTITVFHSYNNIKSKEENTYLWSFLTFLQGNQEVWCGPARGWSYHASEWNSQWDICLEETECSESLALAGAFRKTLPILNYLIKFMPMNLTSG